MLPAPNRMRRSTDFTAVVRRGARTRAGSVVVHQCLELHDGAPRVGLIVGRALGNSVVRHRTSRRLRAQLAPHLASLPAGSGTVVRALPPAAPATSVELGADIARALDKLARTR